MNAAMKVVALLAALAPAAPRAGVGLAGATLAAALAAIPGAGTVFTADGGRIRGTILEAGPGGVSIQLADGTTRKIDAAQVKRVDFSDGTSWSPAPAAAATAAAPAAAAATPAATSAAAAPAAAAGAGAAAPAAAGAGVAVAAVPAAYVEPGAAAAPAKPAGPIVIPVDRLDVVYLANGGRVRGLVVEEVPAEGVLMRLVDGTERRYKPGEVLLVQYANGTVSAQPKAPPPPVAGK